MKRLLLLSNSTLHGRAYLDHAEARLKSFLGPPSGPLLFVPFALADRDAYYAKAKLRFAALGYTVESAHEAARTPGGLSASLARASAVFVGGGNTFRLLREMYRLDLLTALAGRVRAGLPYIGASAGSNLACPTVRTTNDMPIVEPPSLAALALVPFQINAHYLDPDPNSTHMGETREQRLREFHEEQATPVVCLREGAWLHVEGDLVQLEGTSGARLLRRGQEPLELHPPARIELA